MTRSGTLPWNRRQIAGLGRRVITITSARQSDACQAMAAATFPVWEPLSLTAI